MYPENMYENYGIEDPRITQFGEDYYISYSAVSTIGITAYLASTKDFKEFKRHGVIFHPSNKDVEIFPEKINGKYYALHRPSPTFLGQQDIWIAESPDLISWGNHRWLMGKRAERWDSTHVGGSAVPFKTKAGWIEIYHGVGKNNRYCLGAVLLDSKEPWKILARSENPIMEPEADYEIDGFFGNVVFTCGVLVDKDIVKIYYGSSDTYMCYAEVRVDSILEGLK